MHGTIPRRISLIGFMGSGKTTVARLLGLKIGYKYIDLDSLIEQRAGRPVREIFKVEGEKIFRTYESQALMTLQEQNDIVISTGGGAPIQENNRRFFTDLSFTVFLYVSFDEMLKRTFAGKKSRDLRPLLQQPVKDIENLYRQRLPVYESLGVKVITDNATPLEICDEIAFLAGL
ncbi:MAG: shikimate kinase [Spirochaetes bacterium]|nr:shikimate kinase [Spirochaetota bacterium]